MQPHQQRVIEEAAELNAKLNKLTNFLNDPPTLDRLQVREDELRRLRRQHMYMRLYADVLNERVETFEE